MSSTPIYDELAATYLADLTVDVRGTAGVDEPAEPGPVGAAAEPPRAARSGHGTPQGAQATTSRSRSHGQPKV